MNNLRSQQHPEFADNSAVWMVKWHGALSPHPKRAGDFSLEVLLSSARREQERAFEPYAVEKERNVVRSWPLHLLPLIPIGSLWKGKERRGQAQTPRMTFDVHVGDAIATLIDPMSSTRIETVVKSANGKEEHVIKTRYEIPPYRLAGLSSLSRRASMWQLETVQGTTLLVPQAEIHRVYYFYCPEVTRPLVSGALDYDSPATFAPQRLYVGADTGYDDNGRACLRVARGISKPQGLGLARLVFDEVGRRRAALIHRRLVTGEFAADRGATKSALDVGTLPGVLPPFDGTVRWEVEGVPLASGKEPTDPPLRFLVTQIRACHAPPPVPSLVLWLATDNTKGINADDPSLPPAFPFPVSGSEAEDQEDLPDIEDEDPNIGLSPTEIDALLPHQSGLDEIELIKPDKLYQVSQHVGPANGHDVAAGGFGLGHSHWNDELLRPLNIEGTDEEPAEPPEEVALSIPVARFDDFCSACDLVPGLTKQLRGSGDVECKPMPQRGMVYTFPRGATTWSLSPDDAPRKFAVAEFKVGKRYAYAFEAEIFGKESMSLLLIRNAEYTCFDACAIGRIARKCVDNDTSAWLAEPPANHFFLDVHHPAGCAERLKTQEKSLAYTRSLATQITLSLDALFNGRSGRHRRHAATRKKKADRQSVET